MSKIFLRSIMSALSMILTIVGVTVMPGAARAVPGDPDPVINKAVFNNPRGSVAEQHALFIQLARLIDRVPAGETLQLSWFSIKYPGIVETADRPDFVNRLIEAHGRGVKVQVIVDEGTVDDDGYLRLLPVLGGNDAADSFIVGCGANRGCIATRALQYSSGPLSLAYNHNKFLLASKIVLNNGTAVSDVVYQASGNIGIWDAVSSHNDGFTWTDQGTYQAYRTYFNDLNRYRKTASGNDRYYRVTPSGTPYKVHFFPRHENGTSLHEAETDTVVSILNSIKSCSYTHNGTHQTDVRVAMWAINRPAVAAKLNELANARCWVDIVYSEVSDQVKGMLTSPRMRLTQCNAPAKVHSKYMLIDGAYDDDFVPRVFTGSHNYAISALRNADESLVRIMGQATHDDYKANFWNLVNTCTRIRG